MVSSAALVAKPATGTDKPKFTTSETIRKEAKTLIRMLEVYNYNHDAIKESDYADVISDFGASLDSHRMVFLKSDLKELTEKFGPKLHSSISTDGDLSAAFAVFDVYQKRADERIEWIMQQIGAGLASNIGDPSARVLVSIDWPDEKTSADTAWRARLTREFIDERLNGSTTDNAVDILRKRYTRWREELIQIEHEDVAAKFLGIIAQRFDPHSTYFGPRELEVFANGQNDGKVGIGFLFHQVGDNYFISEILPGGPAAQNDRLSAGDQIVAIAQSGQSPVEVSGIKMSEVVELMRGKAGTALTLIYHPADASDSSIREQAHLIRNAISPDANTAKAGIVRMINSGSQNVPLGVIKLTSFYGEIETAHGKKRGSAKDVAQLLDQLQNFSVAGLVLDLRGNGGGLLNEGIEMVGQFVGAGPVVQTRDSLGQLIINSSHMQKARFTLPMVVLVDCRSASAAEIVAGALKDYGRVVVIGERTYGNGTVQAVLDMRSFEPSLARASKAVGAAKITVQKFFFPSGLSPQLNGVAPDIILPFAQNPFIERESDLLHPISSEQISASNYSSRPFPRGMLTVLREHSAERQNNLVDLTTERAFSEHLNQAHTREQSLEIDYRRKQIEEDELLRQQHIASRRISSDGFTFSAVHIDRAGSDTKTEPQGPAENKTLVDSDNPLKDDVQLREALRILQESIALGWDPMGAPK